MGARAIGVSNWESFDLLAENFRFRRGFLDFLDAAWVYIGIICGGVAGDFFKLIWDFMVG